MSAISEHFKFASRAPQELAHLLQEMSSSFVADRAMTPDEKSMALASSRHASNYSTAILDGLESIGHLMTSAASNADFPVSQGTVGNLGCLIYHLAVQLEFLQDHTAEMGFVLHRDELRKPAVEKKGGVK